VEAKNLFSLRPRLRNSSRSSGFPESSLAEALGKGKAALYTNARLALFIAWLIEEEKSL
jgi:hypothetical protein